jgi:hypothetical protein
MELSPSWEAASRWVAEDNRKILWKPKVHNRIHKSPPLVLILCQFNPVHITPNTLSKIDFNITLPLRLHLPNDSFLLAFAPKWYMRFSSPHACYMPCPYHPPWLYNTNYIWWRVRFMKVLITQFSPICYHFIRLCSKYSPQHRVLRHPQFTL